MVVEQISLMKLTLSFYSWFFEGGDLHFEDFTAEKGVSWWLDEDAY